MRIHQNGVISMGTTDQIGKLSVSGSYNDGTFGRSVITVRDDDPTADQNNQIMVLTFSVMEILHLVQVRGHIFHLEIQVVR